LQNARPRKARGETHRADVVKSSEFALARIRQSPASMSTVGRASTLLLLVLFASCDTPDDGSPIDNDPPDGPPVTDPTVPPTDDDPEIPDPPSPPDNEVPPPPDPTPDVTKTVCATGDADFTTLAAAVAAVPTEARLEVCAGTFVENVVVEGKAVHVRGAAGGGTILDGGGVGPALVVRNAPGSGLSLEAVTVQGGKGAGLRCENSGLNVIGSKFTGNTADAAGGGGVWGNTCKVAISTTRFEGNEGHERGGGLFLVESSGEISESVFTANHARYGGGLSLEGGTVTLRKSELRGNQADVHGGGLHSQSDGVVEENLVDGNVAQRKGGGLYFNLKNPVIQRNTVSNNECFEDGAGVFVGVGTALIVENTMTGNRTADDGGGLRLLTSASRVERNMIVGNFAVGTGGGVKVSHMHAVLIDNVIQGNESESSGGGLEMDNDSSIVRGGSISGNKAAWRGGGIHGSLFPFRNATIADVVITGNKTGYGGGILLEDNFYPTKLFGLTITANTARIGGGVYFSRVEYTMSHSVIAGNVASQKGGGMVIGLREDWKTPWTGVCPPCMPEQTVGKAMFVSVTGNSGPEGAGLWTDSPRWSMENSILAGNTGSTEVFLTSPPVDPPLPPPETPPELPPTPPEPVVAEEPAPVPATPPGWRYNNVFPATFTGMADPTGVDGNVSADPMFMNPVAGDYALQEGSTCKDAGDPMVTDADGTRADMGRFGGVEPVMNL
jgi:Periplasmic copper-binding protein (NosD)